MTKSEELSEKRVLWAANVRTKSLSERLSAAKSNNFRWMSVFPFDYKQWISEGMTPKAIRKSFDAAGVNAAVIDPFVQWAPDFAVPSDYPEDDLKFIETTEDEVFEMAEALGALQINAVEGLNQEHDHEDLVRAIGAFADRAGERGLRIGLEPMPVSSIKTLAQGWNIVKSAGRDNLGLTFDTWHFWRSDPDHDLLRSIPGDKIFDVQLVDAKNQLQGTLLEDLMGYRLFPGEGDFDLEKTVSVLKEIGAFRSIGHELFSYSIDELSADEVAQASAKRLDKY